jgi:hypothetical protein
MSVNHNLSGIAKSDVILTDKKAWATPVFEIISNDIVQGGHGGGAEVTTAHS